MKNALKNQNTYIKVIGVSVILLFAIFVYIAVSDGNVKPDRKENPRIEIINEPVSEKGGISELTKKISLSFRGSPEISTYNRYAIFEIDGITGDEECSLNGDKIAECKERVFLSEVREGQNTFVVKDLKTQDQITYTWEVNNIFESGTSELLASSQIPNKAEPRSWRGIIRINCDFSHTSYNDPVVFPGIEGAAHLHRFYGNELVDHLTTLESLVTTGNSTCQGGELNRSGYWIPALLGFGDDNQLATVPAVVGTNEEAHEVFYYSAAIDDVESIQPVPVGLRMIAGEAKATPERPTDTSIARWHCQSWESTDAGNPRWSTTIPECEAPDRVRMDIFFPSCWDGVNLDSADHKSHMAYPIKNNLGETVCPASHPVAIVRPSYHYAFGVKPDVYDKQTRSSKGWKLSSDEYEVSDSRPGGASLHGDWFNAWHPTIMEAMLETCIKERYDCHNGNLANGWRLSEAKEGIQNEVEIINEGAGEGHHGH